MLTSKISFYYRGRAFVHNKDIRHRHKLKLVIFLIQNSVLIIIIQMIRNNAKITRSNQKGPSISNLVQLKLMESEHSGTKRHKINCKSSNAINSIMNTPSTAKDFQKFQSCHLKQNFREPSFHKRLGSLKLISKERGCESTTKIMTLRQIKIQEGKQKIKDDIRQSPTKSTSRKLFVSISKQNSQSLEQNKQRYDKKEDPEINAVNLCCIDQKQERPGIKLNIYKGIARKNTNLIL